MHFKAMSRVLLRFTMMSYICLQTRMADRPPTEVLLYDDKRAMHVRLTATQVFYKREGMPDYHLVAENPSGSWVRDARGWIMRHGRGYFAPTGAGQWTETINERPFATFRQL
jgi:hypothetical protein